MDSHHEHVLLIENDPEIKSLIVEQALLPLGYLVDTYTSATEVFQDPTKLSPDLIITDLNLPAFSCKDLMIALGALGNAAPIIVIAGQGQESDILQAMRLGAADYLICPFREAEVAGVVEKTLNKSRLHRQLEQLTSNQEASQALLDQQRADFLQIFTFYRLALSADSVKDLAESICSLALVLAQADCAWFSAYEAESSKFKLQASKNLPEAANPNFTMLYEDELSSLVAASGQAVTLHGDSMRSYTQFEPFGAALLVPIIDHRQETTVLAAVRNAPQPFTQHQLGLLELVAAIASLSLQKERRKQMLEHLVIFLQQANVYSSIESSLKYDLLRQASSEMRSPLKYLVESVEMVLDRNDQTMDEVQSDMLGNILEQAEILMDITDSMITYRQTESIRLENINLNEILRNTANRFRPIAQLGKISINLELTAEPAITTAYSSQITRVFEGLLSNALKYCPQNSEVILRSELTESEIIVSVMDEGNGIDDQMAERIFDLKSGALGYSAKRFGGIGISLPRIKAVLSAYRGRIWIDPSQNHGFKVMLALPRRVEPAEQGESR